MLIETIMTIFLRSPVWDVIREHAETLNFLDCISENIMKQELKFGFEVQKHFLSNGFLFYILKLCSTKVIVKIP